MGRGSGGLHCFNGPSQPRGPGSAVQGEYRPLQAAARVPLRGQPAEEPLRQGAEDRAARAARLWIAAVAQTVVRVAHLVDLAHDSVRRGLDIHRIGNGARVAAHTILEDLALHPLEVHVRIRRTEKLAHFVYPRFAGNDPREVIVVEALLDGDQPRVAVDARDVGCLAIGLSREVKPGLAVVDALVGCRTHHRSEEHTSELQSLAYLVCRLLLE